MRNLVIILVLTLVLTGLSFGGGSNLLTKVDAETSLQGNSQKRKKRKKRKRAKRKARKRYRRTLDGRCYWRNPAGKRVYVSRTLCSRNRNKARRKYRRNSSGRCYYVGSRGRRVYVPRSFCR